MERTTPLDVLDTHGCVCYGPQTRGCICSTQERVLRLYADTTIAMPPLTPEQRDWCLDDIATVEGYARSDYETATDRDLCRGVLHAWLDYCRDKGLL